MKDKDVVAQVYDTIMSIPGMSEMVKIDLRISRKNALLLTSVIDRGLTAKSDEKGDGMLENLPEELVEELKTFCADCLQKSGLTELSEKLKSFAKA